MKGLQRSAQTDESTVVKGDLSFRGVGLIERPRSRPKDPHLQEVSHPVLRLQGIKRKYDPDGLFFVHHGVGSEEWSADGFTRLTKR